MAKLYHSGIARDTELKQAALIQRMIDELEGTVQILNIHISTEEERVRVFDRSDPAYPILARTLISRRDNLLVTIGSLGQRLPAVGAATAQVIATAA